MAIKRQQKRSNDILATVVNGANSDVSYIRQPVKQDSIIFDKGDGQSLWNNARYGLGYGEWMIVPNQDFKTQVKMWGAGGGAHGGSTGAAGGGGHTYGDVQFLKGIPYVVWVGESGFYNNHSHDSSGNRYRFRTGTTFGGGGGAGHNGGGGGGLSGLFFDAAPTGGGPGHAFQNVATTFRSPGQPTSLLIAGGGGGAGHHDTGHHGQGGGSGGETANHGHNLAQANQHAGGHSWTGTDNPGNPGAQFQGAYGGSTSYTGGGGGGWYGGPSGSKHSTHHNGGGGGSGHLLPNTTTEYPNYWIKEMYPNLVSNAGSVAAPGLHQNHNPAAAGTSDSDYINYSGYGGGNSSTYTPNSSSGNNGRVMIRFKGLLSR